MKLKQLKSILDGVDTFDTPNVHLEQYPTPPDIAAHVMHHVFSQGELEGKLVADLGCGTGILGIGAAILDAGYVIGFDIDAAALEVCVQNFVEMELVSVDTVQCDLTLEPDARWKAMFDTVVMNPPFGTRTKETEGLCCPQTVVPNKVHESLDTVNECKTPAVLSSNVLQKFTAFFDCK